MVSDAAKRCSNTVQLQVALGNFGKYVAIRLSDGGSDDVLYDTRIDAIRHQLHERQCAYIKIPPTGMPPEHAERYLAIYRGLYDRGIYFDDPRGQDVITPINLEQLNAAYRQLKAGK